MNLPKRRLIWFLSLLPGLLLVWFSAVDAASPRTVLDRHDPNAADSQGAGIGQGGDEKDRSIQVGTVHVHTYLNVRTGPWGKIVGKLLNGDKIEIVGKLGAWFKIRWNGGVAYCHSNYVSASRGGQTSSQPSKPPSSSSSSSSSSGSSSFPDLDKWKGGKLSPAEFVRLLGPAARECAKRTGVPAAVTLAQAALETGWGGSTIGDAKNLFGIKGTGPAGSIKVPTKEYVNGRYITIQDNFRKYHNWLESIEDHARFLKVNSRYRNAFKYSNNPDQFAREIHKAGYATAPNYSSMLIQLMKQYNMYRWDQ